MLSRSGYGGVSCLSSTNKVWQGLLICLSLPFLGLYLIRLFGLPNSTAVINWLGDLYFINAVFLQL